MKRELRKAKIIEAIRETKGLLTLAARKAGVTYWTLWDYGKRYPEVREAIDEAKESVLDFAEGKLYEQIKAGNIAAIIFFLKTKGKGRGFIERSEITGAEGTPLLNVNVNSDETRQDITEAIGRFSAN